MCNLADRNLSEQKAYQALLSPDLRTGTPKRNFERVKISYSKQRAKKDAFNRKRGLQKIKTPNSKHRLTLTIVSVLIHSLFSSCKGEKHIGHIGNRNT
jgi:hypothetical protein